MASTSRKRVHRSVSGPGPGPWPLASILPLLDVLWVDGPGGVRGGGHAVAMPAFRRVTASSRSVAEGDLFVAVPGIRYDGAEFALEALERGATAVVSERDWRDVLPGRLPPGRGWIRVLDAKRAVGAISSLTYLAPSGSLTCVGVTGTNGKTTTCTLLRSVLETAGMRTGLLTTVETDVLSWREASPATTPEATRVHGALARIREAGGSAAVLEVSSHGLVQARLEGVHFDGAVFTNLTREHLDYHETLERYLEAKSLLFRRLEPTAFAVLNAESPASRRLSELTRARVVFTAIEGFDPILTHGLDRSIVARHLTLGPDGSRFLLEGFAGEPLGEVRLRLVGRHNVENALGAAAAALLLGVPKNVVCRGLGQAAAAPGRLEPVDGPQLFRVLVDYAHTEDALERVLLTLRSLTPASLRVVMGCGGDRDAGKRPRMGQVAAKLADHTYVTSDNPRGEDPAAIISDIVRGFPDSASFVIEPDRRAAITAAIGDARPGDIVLIAGKGHETSQIIGDRCVSFDDRVVARKALELLAEGRPAGGVSGVLA